MESTVKIKQEPGLSPKRAAATIAATGGSAEAPLSQPATAVIKTERLTSFRVPRDLTLGGIPTNGRVVKPAANKKVYTPNLNAVRNKDTNVKTASTGPKQRAKPDRNKDGKGAGRGKSALIQTTGIFSEGLAQRTLQRSRYEKMNNSSREPGEAMRRPVLRSEIKVDPEEERKRICDLFGEPDEEELAADGVKKYDANMPVKLDNLDYKFKPSVTALKLELKDELPKQEPGDLLDAIKANTGAQNNLFLLQLPDALPGKTDTEVRRPEPAAAAAGGQPEVAAQNGSQDPPRCTVRELEEGYIGKVLRYRSGKVKLLLGETMFDLTMGMDSGFLQELVSINTNAEERSGNIIDLATIKAKLNASPDWEYLFKKAA